MTPTTRPSQQPHRPITSTGKYLLSGHHSITFSFEFYLPALSRILHSCSFFHLSPAFPISLSTIIKRHWLLFRDLLFFWTELIQLSIPSADFLSPSKNIWSTLHSDSDSLAPHVPVNPYSVHLTTSFVDVYHYLEVICGHVKSKCIRWVSI